MQDTILILDHDMPLADLIARTLRSQQIYCELVPFSIPLSAAQAKSPRGLIVAAAHQGDVSLDGFDPALLACGLPMLALGAMVPALCIHYGGTVAAKEPDSENVTLSLTAGPLFEGMTGGERVLHDLRDLELPAGLVSLATATQRCIGFCDPAQGVYAVQYPIERNDTDAVQLLTNFACNVCGVTPYWTEDYIIEQAVESLKAAAGDGRVLCAVSGGVDSAVCARLAHMAVGDRLVCVFVDTGLFRRDEPQTVIESYMDTLGLVVAYVDAQETFLKALSGVRTVADKERIATALLRQVFYKQLGFDPGVRTLVLGTNYNDTLYGGLPADALPDPMGEAALRVAEPLRDLFKDEVRRLARALSLPGTITERQPFPASGLALRVYGEVTEQKLAMLRTADALFAEEISAGGHERKLWQYYASMGDNRDGSEGYVVVLRACQACSGDACSARLPYDLLERVVERVLHSLPEVKRVVYDLTPSQHYAMLE